MPTTSSDTLDPAALSEEERAHLKKHLSRLLNLSESDRGALQVEGEEGVEQIPLPASFLRTFARALSDVAEGRSVSMEAEVEELTTSEAAELLNVSRPYFTRLLKERKIPHRKVGTHRRVLRRDVLRYKKKMKVEAEEALQDLADQAQELGLGYE